MKIRHHLCIDIEGALNNPDDFIGAITVDGKTLYTREEICKFFRECQSNGWRVIPCGDCDNFDYQQGCQGHPIEETKHHEPAVYRLYDYLKENHLGKENGIRKPLLAERLGIKERELRKLTKAINESAELEKLVSVSHRCYMCNTKEECEKAIRTTYRLAVAHFKKAKQMERKVGLNGQVKIKLGEYYKDIVETFSSEEE